MKKKLSISELKVKSFVTSDPSASGGAQSGNACPSQTCYTVNIQCVTQRCANTLNVRDCVAIQVTGLCYSQDLCVVSDLLTDCNC